MADGIAHGYELVWTVSLHEELIAWSYLPAVAPHPPGSEHLVATWAASVD